MPLQQTSNLGGEYTGILLHFASQRQQQETSQTSTNTTHIESMVAPGYLPTWAVLQDAVHHHPRRRYHQKFKRNEAPHPDASVKGVVLPYLPHFQSLEQLSHQERLQAFQNNNTTNNTLSIFLQTFLPVTRGLQTVAEMGLVYQDILPKNIGFLSHHAFLYDNSFLSLATRTNNNHFFCPDELALTSGMDHRSSKMEDPLKEDARALRQILRDLLKEVFPKDPMAKRLIRALRNCTSAKELVQVLEEAE